MQFTVRDKEFDITFVNNYVREKYQELLAFTDELVDLPKKAEEVEQSEKTRKEKYDEIRQIQKDQREIVRDIAYIREEIIQELLETNGYEYDKNWWKRKTDVDDINEFMMDCLQKDVKTSDSKKK